MESCHREAAFAIHENRHCYFFGTVNRAFFPGIRAAANIRFQQHAYRCRAFAS